MLPVDLQFKHSHLQNILREMQTVAIGFSGGIDSTLLVRVATNILGENALAMIGKSETYPTREFEEAVALAKSFGSRYRIVNTEETDDLKFRENPPDRCYFCKNELFGKLGIIAEEEGIRWIADGTITDSLASLPSFHELEPDGVRTERSNNFSHRPTMNLLAESRNIYEQKAWNKRWTTLVIIGFIVFLGLLGVGFDYLIDRGGAIRTVGLPVIVFIVGSLLFNFAEGTSLRFSPFASEAKRQVELTAGEELKKVYLWMFKLVFLSCVALLFYWQDLLSYWYGGRPQLQIPLFHFENKFYVGTIAAFIVGAIAALSTLQWGAYSILRSLDATPADPSNTCDRLLLNIVEEMSIASGIPKPQVYVIVDDSPNAFAVGRSPKHASIVVTQGLLDLLDREELQGVIAHEMSHIRNYDIRLKTVVTALFGSIILLSDGARRYTLFTGIQKASGSGMKVVLRTVFSMLWIITLLAAPIIARLLVMMVSRHREYLADASGAELTRNPVGLAKALAKIEKASTPASSLKRSVAHLCIIDPVDKAVNSKEGFLADLFATHPPTQKRILFLNSMAYEHSNQPVSLTSQR